MIERANQHLFTRRALALFFILALAFSVRALTAQFVGAHLSDPEWFPSGIYAIFDKQAQNLLDGQAALFLIDDPAHTEAAVYPPGYPLWLALIYKMSGIRSSAVVLNVQWVLDALSVLLIVGIAATAYGWRVGFATGGLAGLSPLLALYGAAPLADAPTSWIVLGGAWMLLLAARQQSVGWALAAGVMIGASCWFRANAMLLPFWCAVALLWLLRAGWGKRLRLGGALVLGASLAIAPIVIRNAIAFHAFVPTGLGVGTNLWEGLGETEWGSTLGAVPNDSDTVEQERVALGVPPDAHFGLYHPDGVRRDRERTHKALAIIRAHPMLYATAVFRRMLGVLKYAGKPAPFCGSPGLNVTSKRCLPPTWQNGLLPAGVNLLGMVQSVFRWIAIPLIMLGAWLAFRRDARTTGLILAIVLYYLVVGSLMHTNIRYGLPMHTLLLIFAGLAICHFMDLIQRRRRPVSN